MATAIYRKSSNEVHKISLIDQMWPDIDTNYWGVAVDINIPDGADVREVLPTGRLGNFRVLGFSKIYEPSTNTVRNATQAEIDAFEPFEQEDENIQDADGAKEFLTTHPRFRKLLVAFADILVDEINILRQQFNDTTAEVPQLTTTTFQPRTLAQLRTAILNRINKDD